MVFTIRQIVFPLINDKRIVTFAIKWLSPSSSSYKPHIYMHTYMNSTCMVQGEECFLSSKLLEQDTDNNFKSFSFCGLISPGDSMRVEGGVSDHNNFFHRGARKTVPEWMDKLSIFLDQFPRLGVSLLASIITDFLSPSDLLLFQL